MNQIVVILLATLSYVGNPNVTENLFSYQLQFKDFESCQTFYNQYEDKILNGLLDHGYQKYQLDMNIDYLACGKVLIDPSKPTPQVLDQVPVYKIEKT